MNGLVAADLTVVKSDTRAPLGPHSSMSPAQFCLRWNNHRANIVSVFEQLLHDQEFVDVTIAVEGRSLQAHKMILSACSPYFQAVLASHPDKHPIIILKDVLYSDMKHLLDFMYRGEASIDQENLPNFLRVAESLRIKGLTDNGSSYSDSATSPYILQSGLSQSSPSVVIAPPSSLLASPNTPRLGDPPPLKRNMCSPPTNTAKKRRGRPPKISGEDSETELGVSQDEEPSLLSRVGNIKLELDDDKDRTRPPSLQSGESRAGPSGEMSPKDLSKTSLEEGEGVRQSPGSGLGQLPESWSRSHEFDTDHRTLTPTQSSPLPLVAPRFPPFPHGSDVDPAYYAKNLIEAAMQYQPYNDAIASNELRGSILFASLRGSSHLNKLIQFPGAGMYGDRDHFSERDYLDSPHSPSHSSPQKPSQSSPSSPQSSMWSLPPPSFQSPRASSNSSNESASSPTLNGRSSTDSTSKRNVGHLKPPVMSHCTQENGVHKCRKCQQVFTHPSNFHRHFITVHTDRRNHRCSICGKEFKRKDNMMSHMRSVHRPGRDNNNVIKNVSQTLSLLKPNVPSLSYDLKPLIKPEIPPLNFDLKSLAACDTGQP